MNYKQTKELLIEFLEFSDDKTCNMLSMSLLSEVYDISKDQLLETISRMFYEGLVDIIDNEKDYLVAVKLKFIPKVAGENNNDSLMEERAEILFKMLVTDKDSTEYRFLTRRLQNVTEKVLRDNNGQ